MDRLDGNELVVAVVSSGTRTSSLLLPLLALDYEMNRRLMKRLMTLCLPRLRRCRC